MLTLINAHCQAGQPSVSIFPLSEKKNKNKKQFKDIQMKWQLNIKGKKKAEGNKLWFMSVEYFDPVFNWIYNKTRIIVILLVGNSYIIKSWSDVDIQICIRCQVTN